MSSNDWQILSFMYLHAVNLKVWLSKLRTFPRMCATKKVYVYIKLVPNDIFTRFKSNANLIGGSRFVEVRFTCLTTWRIMDVASRTQSLPRNLGNLYVSGTIEGDGFK